MPRTPLQALAFLLGFWLALVAAPWSAQADAIAQLEHELHERVNALRSSRHLIPLERRADLDEVARRHSLDMARRGFFAHENPEGENPVHRLERGRVGGFTLAAENLGITDRGEPSRAILEAWIRSEVHRTNLHAPPFNATGIGVARRADGKLLYTQIYLTLPR